jgi:hypothetical protein
MANRFAALAGGDEEEDEETTTTGPATATAAAAAGSTEKESKEAKEAKPQPKKQAENADPNCVPDTRGHDARKADKGRGASMGIRTNFDRHSRAQQSVERGRQGWRADQLIAISPPQQRSREAPWRGQEQLGRGG